MLQFQGLNVEVEPHHSTYRFIVSIERGGGRLLARVKKHNTDLLLLDGRLFMLFNQSPLAITLEVESFRGYIRKEPHNLLHTVIFLIRGNGDRLNKKFITTLITCRRILFHRLEKH